MLDGQRGERGEEREQPLARRRARAERRRTPEHLLLERALVLVEQGQREPRPVAEAVEHRALGDPGLARDLVHRHRLDAALGEQPAGGGQDPLAVARGVGALGPRAAGDGQRIGHRRPRYQPT